MENSEYEQDQQKIEEKPEQKDKKMNKKWLKALLIILLLAALAGGAYWWCNDKYKKLEDQKNIQISQLEQDKADLEKQLTEQKALVAAQSDKADQSTCSSPSVSSVQNIKDSITSGNTAALEGYMASKVNVILAASEGIGERTPTQAVGDVTSFIGDAKAPWNFALSATTLKSYNDGFYGKYFPESAIAGKSANNKVISFSFDCNGKIKTVFLTPDASLLTQ